MFQHFSAIDQTGKGLTIQEGGVQYFGESLFQCPEGAEKIAAVNGRDVARLKGGQGLDIVPVQQMPFISLQTADGLHGTGQSVDDLI